jgi:predicted chitinase
MESRDKDFVVKEHVVPMKVIVDELARIPVSDLSVQRIKHVLDSLIVFATITKEEDARLSANGLKSAMPRLHQDFEELCKMRFDRYEKNRSLAQQLGNKVKGDGERFKGRGYIQLSGRYNYTQFAKMSGIPVDRNPKILLDPNAAAKASIWFWKNKVKPAVSNIKNVAAVTRIVNGRALLGLKQRTANFQKYMKLLAPTVKKQGKVK